MKNNSVNGVIWLFFSKFFPPLISFAVFTYSARILEPEDFGLVALALSIITLLTCLMPTGWRQAIIKYQLDDKEAISSIFWFNFFVAALLAVCVILYACLSNWYQWNNTVFNFALMIFSLNLIFDGLFQTLNVLLLKQQQYSKVALRTVVTSVVSACIITSMLYFDYGILALIWVQPLLSLSNFISVYIPTHRYIGFHFSLSRLFSYNKFSIYATLTESLYLLLNHYESIAIGGILGYKDLGLYNIAKRLSTIINDIFINTLNEISFPILASKQKNNNDFQRGFLNSVYLSVVCLFPIFIFCLVASDDIFKLLFTEKWMDAKIAFEIFCISYCLIILGIPQRNVVNLTNNAKWWFQLQFKMAFVIIPLITISAYWGLKYLLLTYVIGKFVNVSISMRKCCSLLNLTVKEYFFSFITPVVCCACSALISSLAKTIIPDFGSEFFSVLYHVVILGIIFFFSYLVMLILLDYKKLVSIGLHLSPSNFYLMKLSKKQSLEEKY